MFKTQQLDCLVALWVGFDTVNRVLSVGNGRRVPRYLPGSYPVWLKPSNKYRKSDDCDSCPRYQSEIWSLDPSTPHPITTLLILMDKDTITSLGRIYSYYTVLSIGQGATIKHFPALLFIVVQR